MARASRCVAVAAVVLCALATASASDDLVLKPSKTSGPAAGLVFLQMEGVAADVYQPIMTALQAAFDGQLYVAVPSFAGNLPNPFDIGSAMTRAAGELHSAGLPSGSPMFYGGHGGGGAMLQNFIPTETSFQSAAGQILWGAFLQRKWVNGSNAYPLATLTVGGELDGACRCTRLAEGYWHQVLHPSGTAQAADFPIVLNLGQNHMQFASGPAPAIVKGRDFHPEISDAAAYAATAEVTAAFMAVRMGNSGSALSTLNAKVQAAGEFFAPIIKGMELEGNYHFKPPCYSNPVTDKCTENCPWTQYTQTLMGNLTVDYEVHDSFHPVWKIPFHLPKIWSPNCTAPTPSCFVNITTVSQAVYEDLDKLDTGYAPVTAHEIRAKMKSRQSIWQSAGIPNANFSITDAGNICADINQVSFKWAIAHAGSRTVERFNRLGEPYTFGPDIVETVGPLWIWTALKYENKTLPNGQPTVELQSIMMKTPNPYWIAMAEGFHYCKLLSPARSMEWLYVDGLRAHDSM